jgi:hypothetical protein
MPIVEIHGKKVHVEEGSHSALHALKYLQHNVDNAKAIFEAAHHDHINGVSHFETNNPAGYHGSTKFTLVHTGNGEYTLRKKEHHLL